MSLINTILLFGGRSAEHEVSILSARSVANAAPKDRIEITPICIARDGRFVTPERSARILAGEKKSSVGDLDFSFEVWSRTANIDVVFPLIHGTGGEDGSLQGYLEMLGLPYVGSGVTASAVGMDKVHMKQAFAAAKLPMVDYVPVLEHEWRHERERVTRAVANALRLPYFVKPANSGSSVGVRKVKNDNDLTSAIEHAFRFDEKVLVERGVDAREIEVAVLGNEKPEASLPGEIVAGGEFYDYADKYVETKSQLVIPAKLTGDRGEELRRLAIAAFKAIGASGFSRVDFFLERGTNRLFVNEINTIPGFTNISMYPKLWEATELKYPRLIERLIALGIERSRNRKARGESTMKWFDEVASLT
ncbi:MAG TPA: D-alanine--D-alanine ligase family protein [Thermoanaerobaculia bacterium]|jgi:D-alanine-D-alanine ligase|nr:D-alanine--D-alanine ligase family protein [Thermoanaerobaculia bacterium]